PHHVRPNNQSGVIREVRCGDFTNECEGSRGDGGTGLEINGAVLEGGGKPIATANTDSDRFGAAAHCVISDLAQCHNPADAAHVKRATESDAVAGVICYCNSEITLDVP